MRPVAFDQMLTVAEWERVRPIVRPLFIREKARRRVTIGGHLTFLFENPQTVWYQVAEMIRAEKIVNPKYVQEELDTYNELLPQGFEVSATLLIEYSDEAERDAALAALVGIQDHLWLRLGEQRVAARFEDRQIADEKAISSVQFVRFRLDPALLNDLPALAEAGRLSIELDHPRLQLAGPVPVAIAQALAEDHALPATV